MAIQNKSYRLVRSELIEEVQGHAYQYEHLASGLNVVFLQTEDTHRAFSISFATPPTDDTGLCHILEHSVCCSSKKYPLKDTFMSLDQGSVNTTLNACTYKDMTMFYASSLYAKDLENILDVYMDLVFYPRVCEDKNFFEQEAWHYDLEGHQEPLTYNGIVYNEMQGEYNEASTWYDYEMHRLLFPDTFYQYDSGGVPEQIVKATHEALVAYHQTYYTAVNGCLCLYGDYRMEQALEWLDTQYLAHLPKRLKPNISLEQLPLPQPIHAVRSYPVENEATQKTLLGMSFVVDKAVDPVLRLAFQMLEHMLLKSAASPLYARLVEACKLGKGLGDSGYDPGKYQPTFTIALYDSQSDYQEAFEREVWQLFQSFVTEGIPKELIEAAFQTVSFGLLEGETNGEPKGVLYTEDVALNRLYGTDLFASLHYGKHLETIAKVRHSGYFERLIETYFLNNTHRVCLAIVPSSTQWYQQEKQRTTTLAAIKKQLKPKAIKTLLSQDEEVCDDEDLSCLPHFSKEDLSLKPSIVQFKERKDTLHFIEQSIATKGIIYTHLLFDTRCVPFEQSHYVGLLAHIVSYLSTEQSSYDALENRINIQTGGLNCSLNAYTTQTGYIPYFKVSVKCFDQQLDDVGALLLELLTQTCFNDQQKLLDLLEVIEHDYTKSFSNAPEYRATKRCYSYFTEVGLYEDGVAGLAFYQFIQHCITHYDTLFGELSQTLASIYRTIIQQEHLIISVTCDASTMPKCRETLKYYLSQLPMDGMALNDYTLTPKGTSEAFMTSTHVQAIAQGALLPQGPKSFNGSMYVASHCINSTYFWEMIRLDGGAYGADMTINRDGVVLYVSYCDPHLDTTLAVFESVGTYLEENKLTQEEVDRLIVGVMGSLDYPATNEQKSEQVIVKYLSGLTDEQFIKERQEVLATTPESLRLIGKRLKNLSRWVCCIGNPQKLQEAAFDFKSITRID